MTKILLPLVIVGVMSGGMAAYTISPHRFIPTPLGQISTLTIPTPPPTPFIIGIPARLIVPTINVDATIESVGLDANNNMAVPVEWNNVGWYQYGARPGETGNAVIDGHLDTTTSKAVFYRLTHLKIGDDIIITDSLGISRQFKVTQTAIYPQIYFPIDKVFGPTDQAQLHLITCEGTFNSKTHTYTDRLVVTARPIDQFF